MADAGDLYDEFGNYIGPELSESEEVSGTLLAAGALRVRSQHALLLLRGREHACSVVFAGHAQRPCWSA